MKTTLEIPDPLFRKAMSIAAGRGQSLKDFVAEALREKIAPSSSPSGSIDPNWMQGFGKLKRLRKETGRVQASIDEEFEVIGPEDRR